ncbi:MAG: protein translocase subunit SecF [Clostridia bacterium]|nr:protein translocase subunit SecF [Clostridia bacterium]
MKLKIVENAKIYFLIPAVIILLGVVFFFVNGGFVQDIDFAGGMTMYVDMGKDVDTAEVADTVKSADSSIPTPRVMKADGTVIVIQTTHVEDGTRDKIQTKLVETYGIDRETAFISVDTVDATMGAELRSQALTAALIACLLMLIYITIRFEFFTGISAVICLLHDVLIMLSFYVIFKIPFNANFIAAMLTIIGYSINNTIVVFDRVRENQRKSMREVKSLVNTSISQTLKRSLYTTITTIVPVILLYILGVDTIKEFALPLMVGLLAGTYSSVFMAGSVWAGFKSLSKKRKLAK